MGSKMPTMKYSPRNRKEGSGETKDGRKIILRILCTNKSCRGTRAWFNKEDQFTCTMCQTRFKLEDMIPLGRFRSIQEAKKWFKKLLKEREGEEENKEE